MILALKQVTLYSILCLLIAPLAQGALKQQRLSNGLELVTYEARKVPLVTIVLAAKAGSFTESPETNGLTHLWEHMFFKGNAAIPNQEAFHEKIRELGIIYNGDTNTELVRYYFTLPSALLEEGLLFMFQAIATPLIDTKELERERKVVLDEWDRNASQPNFEINRLRLKQIYGPLAYLRNPLGERHLIETAQRQQLLKIKDEVFVPENSALLISGDFDSDKIAGMVNKAFNAWQTPKGWQAIKSPEISNFPAQSSEIIKINTQARLISIGIQFQGPLARSNPHDASVADILSGLVNHSLGKFYHRFIDSGISYGAGFSYFTQSHAGELSLWASCSSENYQAVKDALMLETNRWAEPDYFSKEQLDDVRRSLSIDRKFSENRPSAFIKDIAFWWAITGLEFYEQYVDELSKITLKEVQTFAKKYFADKPSITSILLSGEDAQKLDLKDNSVTLLQKLELMGTKP